MKVEILYFSGCPNRVPAVDSVREVLQQEGTPADMVEVEVRDTAAAQQVGFLGSPTIRIDGLDVEPAARAARAKGNSESDQASGSVLYLSSSVVLLVDCLADSVGSAEPHWNLLASSPCIVRGCVLFRHGHRMPRQLG
jgi:hypothetical protein